MSPRRPIAIALATGVLMALTALPAAAEHTHVRRVGSEGGCVILAADSGELRVQLPGTDDLPANRRHPLHVKVHLGPAGMRDGVPVVWVQGSPGDLENCDAYVNG